MLQGDTERTDLVGGFIAGWASEGEEEEGAERGGHEGSLRRNAREKAVPLPPAGGESVDGLARGPVRSPVRYGKLSMR